MLAALIIVFREVFEAGLIIGIVLAVTRTVRHRNRWIGGGVLVGILPPASSRSSPAPCRTCSPAWGRSCSTPRSSALAVVMLTWHNVWMARHGRELAGELRAAGQAVVEGSKSLLALAVVVGVAVLREGAKSCCSSMASSRRRDPAGTWRSAVLSGWDSARWLRC